MPDLDDPRMERAMMELEKDMEHLDENNPKHMAHMMRKMKDLMPPGSMPKELDVAIKRLEAGEDPEKIEEDMGDVLGDLMGVGDEDGGVYNLYPDLHRTLRTNFTALVVGCYESESPSAEPIYTYPECPPRVHFKCWLASDAELVRFTDHPDYLRLLLFSAEAEPAGIDQVLIHLIFRQKPRTLPSLPRVTSCGTAMAATTKAIPTPTNSK